MATLILITIVLVLVGSIVIVGVAMQKPNATRRHPNDGEGDDSGGGAPDFPPRPNPNGGGEEPSWWPEFEREFRAYANRSPSGIGSHRGDTAARAT